MNPEKPTKSLSQSHQGHSRLSSAQIHYSFPSRYLSCTLGPGVMEQLLGRGKVGNRLVPKPMEDIEGGIGSHYISWLLVDTPIVSFAIL